MNGSPTHHMYRPSVASSTFASKNSICSLLQDRLWCFHCGHFWTYTIKMWGCASDFQYNTIQHFQSKALLAIVSAPRFVHNDALYADLKLPTARKSLLHFLLGMSIAFVAIQMLRHSKFWTIGQQSVVFAVVIASIYHNTEPTTSNV